MATKDPAFNFAAHSIISLQELYDGNPGALAHLKHEFKTRGWCILKFPQILPTKVDRMYPMYQNTQHLFIQPDQERILQSFFALPESQKKNCMGYSSFPHKEGVHLITPYVLDKGFEKPETAAAKKLLETWNTIWSTKAVDLIDIMAEPIFGCTKATLADRADLPIAYDRNHGMIDVAFYRNKQSVTLSPTLGASTQDVNCVPHYDPGLFSISFFSNKEGLQLQNPATGEWFAGPVNIHAGQEDLGVIWLGSAAVRATKGELHEAVHRVVYPQSPQPRITAWYEACTTEQINAEVHERYPEKITNLSGPRQMKLPRGDPEYVTRHFGFPMSKVSSREDGFRAYYSTDRQEPQPQQQQAQWTTFDTEMQM